MLSRESRDFLARFMNAASPSGYEGGASSVFRSYLRENGIAVSGDVLGNSIASLNGDAPLRVMLAGHLDEIGFQVVHISDEGLIYFRANGGIDKLNVPSSEVDILTADGVVPGVIGKKPIHLLKASERDTAPELSELWIDIGAENGKTVKKLVAVGDPVAFRSNFKLLGKHRFISKGTDDKVGAFIIAEVMKRLKDRPLNLGVTGVATVQEEVGLRGAAPSAFAVDPAAAIVLDVGFATDLPDIPHKIWGDVKLGGGPILTRSCDNNSIWGQMLRDTAKRLGLPYQESAAHRATGGTDAARIQLSKAGVATALISIPNRYMHSQVEMCDLRDVENTIELITELLASCSGKESFVL